MTSADIEERHRRNDPHVFETYGRVMTLLVHPPGPLADAFATRAWPLLHGGGYALSWRGVIPDAHDVAAYLAVAAADDEMTTILRPGEVRIGSKHDYVIVDVRGVEFQLRPEPMPDRRVYRAMGLYWRNGEFPGEMTMREEAPT